MTKHNALVVVANRLPVDQVTHSDGSSTWQRSPGGLVTALEPVVAQHGGTWVGWAGATGLAPAPFTLDRLTLHPVPLTERDIEDYYEGFSNATLWPLYHDAAAAPAYHRRWWDRYVEVNHRFALAAAEVAPANAVVWVQDYQLQLVPAMLRARRPDLRIGFFLHIPFPPVELFAQLPWRTQLVEGLLGADLLGFQRPEGAQNFLRLATYLCGYEREHDAILIGDRKVQIGSFPISIDVAGIDKLAHKTSVVERATQIRAELGNPRYLLLGVDRLDYIKGIEQRLKAYRELLGEGELTVGETVLVQVATPSRERVEHYKSLREEIERVVGQINGEFSELGTPAIHYLRQSFDTAELCALYRAADVMLVTPLRDGMNLVAKEYVVARPDEGGALVLSEFTGSAAELTGAFLVNPYDVAGVKRAIVRALRIDPPEGQARMAAMREHLLSHDVTRWATDFLAALAEQTTATAADSLPEPLQQLAESADDVWVVSDYDGTLAPFADDPAVAWPAPGARQVLSALAALPLTHAVVASGRPAASIRELLGLDDQSGVGVIGLHGFEVDPALGTPLSLNADQAARYKRLTSEIIATLETLGIPYVWQPLPTGVGEVALLEDKANSVAVHVRRLPTEQHDQVFAALMTGPGTIPDVRAKPGELVLEFVVTPATKADGIQLLRQKLPAARFVVLGDDLTDLDAVTELGTTDVAVIVDRRLPDMVAADRRGTLRPEVAAKLTPAAVAAVDAAVQVAGPSEAVALLRAFARHRAQHQQRDQFGRARDARAQSVAVGGGG